jgi:phage-related protein
MDVSDKPLFWIGSALDDLREFPDEVKRIMGFALRQAQAGGKRVSAKPLRGFGGAGVLEIAEDHEGDTYRTIYTVKFAGVVYVLHAFQKKSTRGRSTAKRDIDLTSDRLQRAAEHYAEGCTGR